MSFTAKNMRGVIFNKLKVERLEALSIYLQSLSAETRSRFGPHAYDLDALKRIFIASDAFFGYIAEDKITGNIIAYSIIKKGVIEHDRFRLESYGIQTDTETDCTFAPSVSDKLQSQ